MLCHPWGPPIRLRAFVTGVITVLDRSHALRVSRVHGVGLAFETYAPPTCGLPPSPVMHPTARVRMDTSDRLRWRVCHVGRVRSNRLKRTMCARVATWVHTQRRWRQLRRQHVQAALPGRLTTTKVNTAVKPVQRDITPPVLPAPDAILAGRDRIRLQLPDSAQPALRVPCRRRWLRLRLVCARRASVVRGRRVILPFVTSAERARTGAIRLLFFSMC